MDSATLEIFDFDWTLARAPGPPRGVARKTFLHSAVSLRPPHVQLRPRSEFWIEEVVREMKSAQRNRETITALITARREGTRERIAELLLQRHLEPDYLLMRAASFQKDKDRVNFKRRAVLHLLETHPEVDKIVLWEDEKEQLVSIRDVARRKKIVFEGNLVTEPGRMSQ